MAYRSLHQWNSKPWNFFLILYLEQEPICECALLFSGASRLSLSPVHADGKLPPGVRFVCVCMCVYTNPIWCCRGAVTRAWFRSRSPCQSSARLCSKFHLAGRAPRQFIAAEALNQARGDHCQKCLCQGRKRPWGGHVNMYERLPLITKLCHCQIVSRDSDFLWIPQQL
jgi:hypothetical protein